MYYILTFKFHCDNVYFQIDNDLKHNSESLLAQKIDVEKAGNAQYYCIHCA
jgi:hypothetical protein